MRLGGVPLELSGRLHFCPYQSTRSTKRTTRKYPKPDHPIFHVFGGNKYFCPGPTALRASGVKRLGHPSPYCLPKATFLGRGSVRVRAQAMDCGRTSDSSPLPSPFLAVPRVPRPNACFSHATSGWTLLILSIELNSGVGKWDGGRWISG